VATLPRHLKLQRSLDNWLHVNMKHSSWLKILRQWRYPKVANSTNHFPIENRQFIIATLNQWILYHKRQSVPLSLLINRFDFHGLRTDRFGSKINKKKPASPSHFCYQSNFSLLLPPANVVVNHRHQQYRHEAPPDQFPSALLFFLLHLLPCLLHCSAKWIVESSTIHWVRPIPV